MQKKNDEFEFRAMKAKPRELHFVLLRERLGAFGRIKRAILGKNAPF